MQGHGADLVIINKYRLLQIYSLISMEKSVQRFKAKSAGG